MVTKEQAMAYKEVIQILKYIPKEEVNKIPDDVIKYYKDNMDVSYNFEVDETKTFEEQNLSEKAKVVLAIFFRDYWATPEQKEKIKKKEEYDINGVEEEKRQKYNTDNIFNNREKENIEEKALVEYKEEKWFDKFINFMKRFFGIKK